MKFSVAILAVAAAFGLASGSPVLEARQEALRFGVVNTHPTSVKLGEVCSLLLVHIVNINVIRAGIYCNIQLDPGALAAKVLGCIHLRSIPQWLCNALVPTPEG